MNFKHPTIVFTAATNLESHVVVEMLCAHGIAALAVEDQSGVSLWALGPISQFHKPNVWVEQSDAHAAAELVREFEAQKRERDRPDESAGTMVATCDECGNETAFSATLNGTTQECSHCGSFIDVGEFVWDEDVGTPDE